MEREREREAPLLHLGFVGNFTLWSTIIWVYLCWDFSLRMYYLGFICVGILVYGSVIFELYSC